jgi:CBS-domain-containing membrane protein
MEAGEETPVSVGRICIRDVDTANADESALVAARRMHDRHVGTLMVLNERETLVPGQR